MSKRYPLQWLEIYQGDKGANVDVFRVGRRKRHIDVDKLSDCAYNALQRAINNADLRADVEIKGGDLRVTMYPRRWVQP